MFHTVQDGIASTTGKPSRSLLYKRTHAFGRIFRVGQYALSFDELSHGGQWAVLHRLDSVEPGRDHGCGCLLGNGLGDAQGSFQLFASWHDFLHKIEEVGLSAVKLVPSQQMQHGIAKACPLRHAQRCTARGHDAAFDL